MPSRSAICKCSALKLWCLTDSQGRGTTAIGAVSSVPAIQLRPLDSEQVHGDGGQSGTSDLCDAFVEYFSTYWPCRCECRQQARRPSVRRAQCGLWLNQGMHPTDAELNSSGQPCVSEWPLATHIGGKIKYAGFTRLGCGRSSGSHYKRRQQQKRKKDNKNAFVKSWTESCPQVTMW